MARISKYESDGNIALSDTLLGSDAGANNATKNYSISNIKNFLGGYFISTNTSNTTDHEISKPLFLKDSGGNGYSKLSQFGKLELQANSTATGSHGGHGVIRAGLGGEMPTSSDFGNFSFNGDIGGKVQIMNESGPKSTVISLSATSAQSTKTVFGIAARPPGTPTNPVASGYGGSHAHLLVLSGKADLTLQGNSAYTSIISAKKFISLGNTNYYVQPSYGTKINELQANKITPITSGSTSGAASSIFAIPKVSSTQQSGFNAANTQAGVLGQMLFDDNYIYICTQAGSNGSAVWKRAAISTF